MVIPIWLISSWTWIKKLPWAKMLPYILVILAFAGAFVWGFHKGDHRATERIAAYEKSLSKKEDKIAVGQAKVDSKVITQYKTRVERVYIERDVNKALIPSVKQSATNLPAGWVYVHNLAAEGGLGETKKASDATDSQISTNRALETVTKNYAMCRAELERFSALQQWNIDTAKNVADANRKGKK